MRSLVKYTYISVPAFIVASAILLLMQSNALGDDKQQKKMDGKILFETKCLKCHKPAKFKEQQNDRKGWELILSRMQRGNCVLTDEEIDILSEYLAQEFGE